MGTRHPPPRLDPGCEPPALGTVKLGLLGAVALLLAGAYAFGMTWWFEPLEADNGGRLPPLYFDIQGIAPIGYTQFAVALGVFAGTMSKKVLPAIGATFAGYFVVRVLIETLARPRYISPLTTSLPISSAQQPNFDSSGWVLSQGITNGTGKLVAPNSTVQCAAVSGNTLVSTGSCDAGLGSQGLGQGPYSNWVRYQPDSRFWDFQGIETGISSPLPPSCSTSPSAASAASAASPEQPALSAARERDVETVSLTQDFGLATKEGCRESGASAAPAVGPCADSSRWA
jgi:hypothetical protein